MCQYVRAYEKPYTWVPKVPLLMQKRSPNNRYVYGNKITKLKNHTEDGENEEEKGNRKSNKHVEYRCPVAYSLSFSRLGFRACCCRSMVVCMCVPLVCFYARLSWFVRISLSICVFLNFETFICCSHILSYLSLSHIAVVFILFCRFYGGYKDFLCYVRFFCYSTWKKQLLYIHRVRLQEHVCLIAIVIWRY